MTQIAYFSLNVTPTTYSSSAIAYIGPEPVGQRGFINGAAEVLGMANINTAIAGAMAEENDSYNHDIIDLGINFLSDYYALSAADPAQFVARLMEFSDWRIGLPIAAAEFGVDLLPGVRRTHAEWATLYAVVEDQDDTGLSAIDKFINPVLMDLGKGNIKLATAIRLHNNSNNRGRTTISG